jgi:CRISPR/Cas system-associated exonuclease Cas4 (RecB family)
MGGYGNITNFAFDITVSVIFVNVCSSNKNLYLKHIDNLNTETRQRNNLYLPQANLTIHKKEAYCSGIKIFNHLPLEVKNVGGNQKKF